MTLAEYRILICGEKKERRSTQPNPEKNALAEAWMDKYHDILATKRYHTLSEEEAESVRFPVYLANSSL